MLWTRAQTNRVVYDGHDYESSAYISVLLKIRLDLNLKLIEVSRSIFFSVIQVQQRGRELHEGQVGRRPPLARRGAKPVAGRR